MLRGIGVTMSSILRVPPVSYGISRHRGCEDSHESMNPNRAILHVNAGNFDQAIMHTR